MAYTRQTLFSSDLLTWQNLTLEAAHPDWSVDFRVAATSLLLPVTHCFGCQLNSLRFVCDPTTSLWLTPDEPYRLRRPWSGQRSSLITLTVDVVAPGRAALPLSAHAALHGWQRRLRTGEVEPLAVEEALLALTQANLPVENLQASSTHRAVERAREHIAAAPQAADTLSYIATAAHFSAFHLARAFRRHTGHSLHGYRTRLRMGLALMRLHEGEENLTALALDLGYASHSHFSGAFRRHFGVTPSLMRTLGQERSLR
jgi:AraC family transcriptional regulator